MKGMRMPILIGLLVVILGIAYSTTFIVTERDQAIVMRFGEIRRTIKEPGIYFKVPTNFVDTVQFIDKRLQTVTLNDKRVQVRDGRRYVVDAFATYRITGPRQFKESVQANMVLAQDRLQTRLDAALRRVYGQREFNAALSAERAAMMREVRDLLRPEALLLGVTIVDVRVQRTDLLPEVSARTFDRMKAERLAEAAQLRALGTQTKLRIEAEADREAVVTVAKARRESEIVRGKGEAQRNKIFAEAFSKDPEFFAFYRSMKAYVESMGGSDTTMVLSPNTEFFRYFGNEGGASATKAPAAPATGSRTESSSTTTPAATTPTTTAPTTTAPATTAPGTTTE